MRLELMKDHESRSLQCWNVSFDGNRTLQNTPKNEKDISNGPSLIPSSGAARLVFNDELNNTGTNVTISDITPDGIKNLVINLGHPQNRSPHPIRGFNTCNMSISPRAVMELDNLNRAKPVISEALPVPTASPGTADIVGFGTAGVSFVRNSMNIQKREVISSFGYDAGWRVDKHIRLVADTTGNKLGDLVGFGEMGVWISRNNGDNTFQTPKMVLPDFSYAAGWRVDKHPRFMADIRNIGRADIIGFGDDGVFVSLNNGDGTFSPASLVTTSFGYNSSGWRLEKHLRFLADTNGNGLLDIVGFGEDQVEVAFNNGNGTFQPSKGVLTGFCYSQTWRVDHQLRFVADLTGSGKPDLVGFANDGVYAALNNGDGTFQPIRKVSNELCVNNGGWNMGEYPRFIADLTGNGCGDIIGFGHQAVWVAINNGDGTFQPSKSTLTGFNSSAGWRVKQHPRFLVDLTGDGRPDILGFANRGIYVSYNDGKGNFTEVKLLILGFGGDDGWMVEKTERYVANLFHT